MKHKARPKGKVTDPSTRPKHSHWPQASGQCVILIIELRNFADACLALSL